jgi:hypothetical protein
VDKVEEFFPFQLVNTPSQYHLPCGIQSPEIAISIRDTKEIEGQCEELVRITGFFPGGIFCLRPPDSCLNLLAKFAESRCRIATLLEIKSNPEIDCLDDNFFPAFTREKNKGDVSEFLSDLL